MAEEGDQRRPGQEIGEQGVAARKKQMAEVAKDVKGAVGGSSGPGVVLLSLYRSGEREGLFEGRTRCALDQSAGFASDGVICAGIRQDKAKVESVCGDGGEGLWALILFALRRLFLLDFPQGEEEKSDHRLDEPVSFSVQVVITRALLVCAVLSSTQAAWFQNDLGPLCQGKCNAGWGA